MSGKSRSEKAFINSVSGVADELVSLACNLVLTRVILTAFGSAYNGITASIIQFISCISLMRAGIGGVTRVALYKPLAEKNYHDISAVVAQTEKFMRRIAMFFAAFAVVFAAIYPVWVSKEFDWLFSASLVIIVSFSTFAQYYFGLTYKLVLSADQRFNVVCLVDMASKALNLLISVVLVRAGAGIHLVKLGSSAVHVLSPVFLCVYTRREYHIDTGVQVKTDLLRQRWDAVGHEVANFVNNNTDIMLLTFFTDLRTVSVYTIYHRVTESIHNAVLNTLSGVGPAFGNMNARNEHELMRTNLRLYEVVIFSMTSTVFPAVMVMITPFAVLYTHGVTDIDYSQPLFGLILALAGVFTCFQIPYETVVNSVGHYKQTRNAAFAEAIINIVISVACVIRYGLVGVAVGTLVAAVFRSFQYAIYLSRNIIKRSLSRFVWHMLLALAICFGVYFGSELYMIEIRTVWDWICMAAVTTLISFALTAVSDLLFYRSDTKAVLLKLKNMFFKKRGKQDRQV